MRLVILEGCVGETVAALEAADEIGLAVIATSFTIIAVFVPARIL